MKTNTIMGAIACLLMLAVVSRVEAEEVWAPWADLAKLKPSHAELIRARTDRGWPKKDYKVQRVSKGTGAAVNVDEYAVQIDKLPDGMSEAALFKHIRVNLNTFLDQSVSPFEAFDSGDDTDWKSGTNPLLGTIMVFEIKVLVVGHDEAAVVVSEVGDLSWTFSPIEDGGVITGFGTHPVAGNRQFGMRKVGGKLQFYTRAFDRVYPSLIPEGEAFGGADKLWRSLQANIVAFVNDSGGTATVLVPNVPGGNDPSKKPKYSEVCADTSLKLKC